jgi:hypothetical protein
VSKPRELISHLSLWKLLASAAEAPPKGLLFRRAAHFINWVMSLFVVLPPRLSSPCNYITFLLPNLINVVWCARPRGEWGDKKGTGGREKRNRQHNAKISCQPLAGLFRVNRFEIPNNNFFFFSLCAVIYGTWDKNWNFMSLPIAFDDSEEFNATTNCSVHVKKCFSRDRTWITRVKPSRSDLESWANRRQNRRKGRRKWVFWARTTRHLHVNLSTFCLL